MRKIVDKNIEKINTLLLKGYKKGEIAKILGISPSTVYSISMLLEGYNYKTDDIYSTFDPLKVLSKAELVVYEEIVNSGLFSKKEIADKLCISEGTVSTHLHRIRVKLNCRTLTELVYKHFKTLLKEMYNAQKNKK